MSYVETTREDRAAVEALAVILLAERRGAPMSPKLNDVVRPLAELYRDDHGDPTVPVTYFDSDARELMDTGSPAMLREAAESLRASRHTTAALVLEYTAFAEELAR